MDTSETRIKMCKKAEEIQKQWKPVIGDWFYKEDGIGYGLWLVSDVQILDKASYYQDLVLYCSGERMHSPPFGLGLVEFRDPESYVWLPHQDQLQEMIISLYGNNMWVMLSNFRRMHPMDNHGINSMEQLWLAFVMKEKYNKVWDGEEWQALKGGT